MALYHGDNRPKAKQRAKKGLLTLDDVRIRASEQNVIQRPDSLKDTRKQTLLKDMFAKGAKPKSVSGPEVPTAEVAPKLGNILSEEVVVGLKDVQSRRDFEKNQIIGIEEYPKTKYKAALEKMRRETLLNYVEKSLFATKTAIGQCSRAVRSKYSFPP